MPIFFTLAEVKYTAWVILTCFNGSQNISFQRPATDFVTKIKSKDRMHKTIQFETWKANLMIKNYWTCHLSVDLQVFWRFIKNFCFHSTYLFFSSLPLPLFIPLVASLNHVMTSTFIVYNYYNIKTVETKHQVSQNRRI